jgi:hypothetical protein
MRVRDSKGAAGYKPMLAGPPSVQSPASAEDC